jgi:anaerobic carbon-monoxide dehydrogenase iron sulfur subunit
MTTRLMTWPDRCRNCQACTLACSLYHEGRCSLALARLAVDKDLASGEIEMTVCRQCEDAACVEACPIGAMRHENGVVFLAEDECVGCGACAEACPYGAIIVADDRYLKCDLCLGRVGGPLCVEMCPVEALTLQQEAVEAH